MNYLKPEENPLRLVVPTGHTKAISSVAFSPNRRLVLTGSKDGIAKLWNLEGQELVAFAAASADKVFAVAFSKDGNTILTGNEDKKARLWGLPGNLIREIPNGDVNRLLLSKVSESVYGITASALYADTGLIVNGHMGGKLTLWKVNGEFAGICKHPEASESHHNAWIHAVAFSPEGKLFLSGSRDKTAILWDLEGNKKQTFQGQHEGEVSSVAFSLKGDRVLTGGYDGKAVLWTQDGSIDRAFQAPGHGRIHAIAFFPKEDHDAYILAGTDQGAVLWDKKGNVYREFKGQGALTAVAFSPDGELIFSGSPDSKPRLWGLDGNLKKIFEGHASCINAVSCSKKNQILCGSSDGTAKLWDPGKSQIQVFEGGGSVSSVAFSPGEDFILTGSGKARLWNLAGEVHPPKPKELEGHEGITSVAFSPSGRFLLTGGHDTTAKSWDLTGNKQAEFIGHTAKINSVAFSPDEKWVLTSGGDFSPDGNYSAARIWDLKGNLKQDLKGNTHAVSSAVFCPAGNELLIFTTGGVDANARLWSLDGKQKKGPLRDPRTDFGLTSGAFDPHGNYLLTGCSNGTARLLDLDGNEIHLLEKHLADITSVAFSPDGKYVLTAGEDGAIIIWNKISGEKMATLAYLDQEDWAAIAPSGLFDASPGAMLKMYFVSGLEVIELDQLKERYYEPGLLSKIVEGKEEDIRYVDELEDAPLYPKLNKYTIANGRLQIELEERSGGIGKASLFINNKEVLEDANPDRKTAFEIELPSFKSYFLPGKEQNTIALRLYNKEGWLKSPVHQVKYTDDAIGSKGIEISDEESEEIMLPKPCLYAIITGTSKYRGGKLDLAYPDQDAASMASAIRAAGKKLFDDRLDIQLLTTQPGKDSTLSSKKNIEAAFARLAGKAQPQDVVFVYFSGHGANYGSAEKGQFYYLTKDIGSPNLSDSQIRKNGAVSSEELTRWLNNIPARKQVLVFDTCHSGKVIEGLTAGRKSLDSTQERALERMKDRTGMFVLAGSSADKVSFEASRYGQGLLTYSLLWGMKGAALKKDDTSRPTVDVMKLFQYSRDEVPRLAKDIAQAQEPVLAFPFGGDSFPIGITDSETQAAIKLAQPKPIFIRSVFLDSQKYIDHLELSAALDNRFIEAAAKGKDAQAIFVDTSSFPNAWIVRGLYSEKKGKYEVKAKLYQGKELKQDLTLTGKEASELAQNLEKQIATIIKIK